MTDFNMIWPDLASVVLRVRADESKHTDGTHKHPIPAAIRTALEKAHEDGVDIDGLLALSEELARGEDEKPTKGKK